MKKLLPVLLSFSTLIAAHAQQGNAPKIVQVNGRNSLWVDGAPFLLLGGELGNSSASSNAYMKPIWPKLKAMHLNAVLTPVYWELMEPEENKFDFTLLDTAIHNARLNNMKLVLLWFGSWKNSMSCYAPAWVKKNTTRFLRAQDQQGKNQEIISAFENNNLQADIKAFKALMTHIKSVDASHRTVLMIQVENEIGMLPEAREYTQTANNLFQKDVPTELVNYLKQHKEKLVPEFKEHWAKTNFTTTGNWENMFGKSLETDELFQAWHYAKFAGAVAAAGKSVYDIPMFVNAALNYKNVKPGQYPSAGPLPQVMDLWQAAAPSIDMLSPDFYNPYFKHYSELYVRQNNPYFIPEIRFEPDDAAKVFYAIGHHNAMGFSPFSIEDAAHPADEPVAKSYAILHQLAPYILQQKGNVSMDGVLLEKSSPVQTVKLGKYEIKVSHELTLGWSPKAKDSTWAMGGGIILQTGEDNFIIAGTGIVCTFSQPGSNNSTGILQSDEGYFENGKWIAGRRMNGDQDHQGRHIRIPAGDWGIQKVSLYSY